MNTSQQINSEKREPETCKTCKNFYGTPERDGLCSGCYNRYDVYHFRIHKKQENKPIAQQQEIQVKQQQQKPIPERPIQQNTKRCWDCKKKTGYLGVQCKCGYYFCNAHRLPEDHQCDYNHQEQAKRKLSKQIVKIDHLKMERLQSK